MLKVEGKWIWDSWYVEDRGTWHAFFLQADTSLGDPELRHWNVSHGHATSSDLENWSYRGTVFAPSQLPAFDDYTVWTGSVVRGDDGVWHLFYTGTSRAEAGLIQRIGHATSTNLSDWERKGVALDLRGPNAEHYEGHVPERWKDQSLRDPWVMRDPEGPGWLMYFTARSPVPQDTMSAGAIGLARSPDLVTWTLEPPVFIGGFGEIEVPTVFDADGRWYCTFCTTSACWSESYRATSGEFPVSGIHYLVAESHLGPWSIAEGPFLHGTPECVRYAPRWLRSGTEDLLMSCQMREGSAFAGWLADPEALRVATDGRMFLAARSRSS